MKFRLAIEADAEGIALLHAGSWQRTYRGMMSDEFLTSKVVSERLVAWQTRMREDYADRLIQLAEDGERLAGFICAFGNQDPQWGSYIDNLHVAREYQGSGLGSALMAAAGRWLCEHFADAGVYLWVFEANLSARRFYERLGARNHETIMMAADPDGSNLAPTCRYVWDQPQQLLRLSQARRS